MTFVNEYIPKADLKKYNFAELINRPTFGDGISTDWTIDREADIWLHKFYTESDHTAPDGGYTGVSVWDFYWKGTLMLLKVKSLASGGGHGEHRWQRKKLLSINIPINLETRRSQIIQDIEAAFTTYRGAGVLSVIDSPSYSFELVL